MTALAFPTGPLSAADARKRVRIAVRGTHERTLFEESTCRAMVDLCIEIARLIALYHEAIGVLAVRTARMARRDIMFRTTYVSYLGTELGLIDDVRAPLTHELERIARAYLDDPTPPALSASIRALLYQRRSLPDSSPQLERIAS